MGNQQRRVRIVANYSSYPITSEAKGTTEIASLKCCQLSPERRFLQRKVYIDQNIMVISQQWENTSEAEEALRRRVAELNRCDAR